MAFSVMASVTDLGRQRVAQMMVSGRSFKIMSFSVGSGGHDPLDPETALTPDTSLTDCPSVLFGPKVIPDEDKILVSSFCPQFTCTLLETEAIAPISNLCLIGETIYPTTDPDYGVPFLFAIANFPLKVKTGDDVFEFRVRIQM